MRGPLTAQWDCVWLLLADHNTMKKEPLRETNDTSPHELHHFPSKVFRRKTNTRETGIFPKEEAEKPGLNHLQIWWLVRAKQNHWRERGGDWVKMGMPEKCSEVHGMSVECGRTWWRREGEASYFLCRVYLGDILLNGLLHQNGREEEVTIPDL